MSRHTVPKPRASASATSALRSNEFIGTLFRLLRQEKSMRHLTLRPAATWAVSLALCLFFCVTINTARAQTQITTGVIQGTVVDESGALLPGAQVEVKNVDTNATQTFSTNDDGR